MVSMLDTELSFRCEALLEKSENTQPSLWFLLQKLPERMTSQKATLIFK